MTSTTPRAASRAGHRDGRVPAGHRAGLGLRAGRRGAALAAVTVTGFTVTALTVAGLAGGALTAGAAAAGPPQVSGQVSGRAAATRPVQASVGAPPVPAGLPSGIEDLAPYVRQVACDPAPKPGTLALGRLLTSTYAGTAYLVEHDCGADPIASEHQDGRALDWLLSARSTVQAAQAQAFLGWLFASDAGGRAFANARRLGVMYVIWNDRIWGAWAPLDGWAKYSTCAAHPEPAADTVCHRNQLHVSLSWDGALGHDSFWSRTVSRPDYGPCRPRDLNWAPAYTTANPRPCPDYPALAVPKGASAILSGLVKYSGATVGAGDGGAVVSAVQRGLGVPADGQFGAFTADALTAFQRRHSLTVSGTVDAGTWRALLAVHAVKLPVEATTPVPANPLTRYATTVLRYDARGAAVLALQKALGVSASGWFGPKTLTAVRALQTRAKLPVTGVVDTATWKALGA